MNRIVQFFGLLMVGLVLAWGCSRTSQAQAPLQLGLPIRCQLNQDCFVLLYPDRDPAPNRSTDFGCGRMTYDTHKGTDFAVPDQRAIDQGVDVVAAAPGTVLRVRDGVPDRRIRDPKNASKIEKTACGNGMVIDHGKGWTTQYCHLQQGSVVVQPGDSVRQGQKLGRVGLSGRTTFPHVHLTVRLQDQVVDPFVGPQAGPGCQVERQPLWSEPLPYQPTGLVRAGFAPQPPELDELWQGKYHDTQLAADSNALLFWVQTYGILAGDRERFLLVDPTGAIAADNTSERTKPLRISMRYIGKRRRTPTLTKGQWRGQYQLIRDDRVLLQVEKSITVE